ncbi:MAG: prolipoprotein diacylglyceryl transferase [Planctomycetota bacterium]|nr:MAG: prolipoprotein diacylglyceryl transferase [Planctomycetota bacterium]
MLAELLYPRIDPVLLELFGPLAIRWYGLSYLLAFLAGAWVLRRLSARGFLTLDANGISDFMVWSVAGVLLGGRIGWVIVYGHEQIHGIADIFQVWKGGMSFHGGLIGMAICFFWFAKRRGISGWRMADAGAIAAAPGIFAVRMANFLNGELYGRITDQSVPWAMRFPSDPVATRLLSVRGLATREKELRILEAYDNGSWAQLRQQVPLRHPSQLYEAFAEGILLGLTLWLLLRLTRGKELAAGSYAAIFAIFYGAVRFVIEFYRQPDAQFRGPDDKLGTVLGPFSMGQVLCAGMILGGLFIWFFLRKKEQPESKAAA